MALFLKKKFRCEEDDQKFDSYEQLIQHSRKVHHRTISKCNRCGKLFQSEKDRLHHVREHGKP
jgi:uncharacterized C2H2 Zn-finger protein